ADPEGESAGERAIRHDPEIVRQEVADPVAACRPGGPGRGGDRAVVGQSCRCGGVASGATAAAARRGASPGDAGERVPVRAGAGAAVGRRRGAACGDDPHRLAARRRRGRGQTGPWRWLVELHLRRAQRRAARTPRHRRPQDQDRAVWRHDRRRTHDRLGTGDAAARRRSDRVGDRFLGRGHRRRAGRRRRLPGSLPAGPPRLAGRSCCRRRRPGGLGDYLFRRSAPGAGGLLGPHRRSERRGAGNRRRSPTLRPM
ncbi:MAG: hypothetical protein AVDCRST_MAG73-2940, partial [uncultured Thermomicrobiales bacterium]